MTARDSFAIHLEASGPGPVAARAKERFGSDVVASVRAEWSGRLLAPSTTRAEVEAALGAADEVEGDCIKYALASRPGYLYCFDFDPSSGCLRGSRFRTDSMRGTPSLDLADPKKTQHVLASIGATADELLRWLGPPTREYGWWPMETWDYGDGLVLNLRNGIVET